MLHATRGRIPWVLAYTSEDIKPQPKKIEAMTQTKPPTNSKQLKQFLGMINFYRDA